MRFIKLCTGKEKLIRKLRSRELSKYYGLLFCVLFFVQSYAQNFDPSSQISVVTASPGEILYNSFGHSAIRINDTINGYDKVYNYGIFNFRTPNFYGKFIRGKLLYSLGLQRYNGFVLDYKSQGRQVTERVLNLNESQKAKVLQFLAENYKPENRKYLYDFFYDNCASRIRDVFEQEAGINLVYDTIGVKQITFRQLLDEYLYNQPWSDFGIDLILGLPADKKADFRNQMFLPDYLEQNLSKATYDGKPLLGSQKIVSPLTRSEGKNQLFTPLIVMCLIALFYFASTFFINNNKVQRFLDAFLFGILAIAGCVFLFMWLGTDHRACYQNLNMLWANPLYVLLIPYAKIKDSKLIWWAVLILMIVLILAFPIFPQQYNMAFIPIFFMVVFRCIKNLRD